MDYVVISLDAIIILTWLGYAFVFRNERKDPKVRENLLSLLVIAVAMIVFVGLLAWKFRGVQMVPAPGPSRHYNQSANLP